MALHLPGATGNKGPCLSPGILRGCNFNHCKAVLYPVPEGCASSDYEVLYRVSKERVWCEEGSARGCEWVFVFLSERRSRTATFPLRVATSAETAVLEGAHSRESRDQGSPRAPFRPRSSRGPPLRRTLFQAHGA